jgi:hypothetical protein
MKKLDVILLITLALFCFSGTAYAQYQIQFDAEANRVMHLGGNTLRGNFATKKACLDYWKSRSAFERNHSKCVGPSGGGYGKQDFQMQMMESMLQPFFNNLFAPPDTSVQDATNKKKKIQQQQADEKKKQAALQAWINLQYKEAEKRRNEDAQKQKRGQEILTKTQIGSSSPLLPFKYERAKAPEQNTFEKIDAAFVEIQKKLIRQRLEEPNKWCNALAASLTTKAPPLPYKKFNELQPGDVLLIEPDSKGSEVIREGDRYLSGDKTSDASHTVLYLKEVNGRKLFLDNQPGEGPRIVEENYLLKKYGQRKTQVAQLAQPLNKEEGDRLYAAAKEMEAKNKNSVKEKANNWFDKTNYGGWGKDDVVCSEADWALINAAGRKIPKSGDKIKMGLGNDYSPADYRDSQYFLVTPLAMSQ